MTADQANFSRKATEHVQGRNGELEVSFPELVNHEIPVPVSELNATNPWGLRHMLGNVYEVTMSCWSDTHLGLSTDRAYLEHTLTQQACERIVAKGGAYTTAMDGLRPARRIRPKQDRRRDFSGFRVVRSFEDLPGN